jgi:hypothetical protein
MKLKKTLITKDISEYTLDESLRRTHQPIAGDVAIFEILEIGKHRSVQSAERRGMAIFEGDFIMAAFADRYATSQFEGYVPKGFQEIYHILGAGGAVGLVRTKNAALEDIEPTTLRLLGFVTGSDNKVINTKFYRSERVPFNATLPFPSKVILSIGSTMDSGKTTTAAHVARGLKTTGKTVAYLKFTGTAFTKDKDFVLDCGADITYDFSDLGYPSTYMCSKEDLLDVYQSLLHLLQPHAPEYIVMEIADGLLQQETDFLLRDQAFMSTIHSVVFSCGDSLSALQGVSHLNAIGIQPALLSGTFTMSPLLIEEVKQHSGMPVLTIDELMTGQFNHVILQEHLTSA